MKRAYLELIGYTGTLRGFRTETGKAFAYLVGDFAFQPLAFEETSYGALCRFENSTTVVEIHLDWTEELISPYVRPGDRSDARRVIEPPGVLLDAIMIHRGDRPEKQVSILKSERMQRTLSDYARALQADASEALRGDFSELILIRASRPEANWRLLRPRE